MKVRLKDGLIVLTAEQDGERQEVSHWIAAHADHVLIATAQKVNDRGRRAKNES